MFHEMGEKLYWCTWLSSVCLFLQHSVYLLLQPFLVVWGIGVRGGLVAASEIKMYVR